MWDAHHNVLTTAMANGLGRGTILLEATSIAGRGRGDEGCGLVRRLCLALTIPLLTYFRL